MFFLKINYITLFINLFIVISVLIEVKSDLIRTKRQSRRLHKDRVNATSIILETEERINNRTLTQTTNSTNKSAQMLQTCGGIFSEPQFLIESPRYPSNYPSNAKCLYIFKGPYCVTNYTLQILDFNLEDSLGCINDRLEVKQRDVLCSSQEGFKQYVTQNGILELNFVSNGDTTGRGFRILVSRSLCLSTPSLDELTTTSTTTTTRKPFLEPIPDFLGPIDTFTVQPSFQPTLPPSYSPSPRIPDSIPNDGIPRIPSGRIPGDRPPNEVYPNAKERPCCATTYSDKRFFLSSPGFPHSPNTASQCSFTIYRASPKVCRLRIQMHYFWVGEQDSTCSRGYLQIDGKLVCGCHTGLKIVSPFDSNQGNTKVFRYLNIGANFDGHAFSGFVLEVIQDECPKRYSPDQTEPDDTRQTEILPRFNFYNDQFNRVAFPNLTHEELSSVLLNANTEVFEPIDLGFRPRVVKHVYYFESPDYTYDVSYSYNKPREVEETNYLETVDLNALYPSGTDLNKCTMWNSNEWKLLCKDVAWQRMPKCTDISTKYIPQQQDSGCKEYSFLKGYFQSPGYPYYYPKNLNCCYRFYKQRGYCKIRLIILDFQVEDSYDCRKDYLLLNNNFRYCGQSLANTFTLFDMSGKSYEQINFVTNEYIGGRGFRGIYEQIPCSDFPHTRTPPSVPPPTPPPPPPSMKRPNTPCLRQIKDDYFTIDIYDYGKDMCNFDVYKSHPNICRLEITFVTFEFPCDVEYLEINGRKYCGNLSGEMVYLGFEGRGVISIIYKRLSYKAGSNSGLKLHMVGRQSSRDCVQLPPASRILNQAIKTKMENDNEDNNHNNWKIGNDTNVNHSESGSNNVSVVINKKYPEVCGIVMTSKDDQIESLCNIIINNLDIECSLISENAIYVPFSNTTLGNKTVELKFKDLETVEKLEFKEITCDNKFIL